MPCAFCEGLLQPRSSRRILRKSRRCGVTLQKKRGPFMRSAALALVTAELLLACSAFHNVHVTPVRQTWPLAGLRVAGACTHTPPRRQCTRGTVQASGSERLTAASEATTRALAPDKRGSVHFINLSNGVEVLPILQVSALCYFERAKPLLHFGTTQHLHVKMLLTSLASIARAFRRRSFGSRAHIARLTTSTESSVV